MPYIPKEHEKYDVLPFCRKHNIEVFEYPSELIYEIDEVLDGLSEKLIPYGFKSYEEYYEKISSLLKEYADKTEIIEKLEEIKEYIIKNNKKEEWSILKYIGELDDKVFGLTNGKNYYWPTSKENPVYHGVIDDEEFTAYLYSTDKSLWEILEDPTGMAYQTIYENDNVDCCRPL